MEEMKRWMVAKTYVGTGKVEMFELEATEKALMDRIAAETDPENRDARCEGRPPVKGPNGTIVAEVAMAGGFARVIVSAKEIGPASRIEVETANGRIVAEANRDPSFPGIDVEYVGNGEGEPYGTRPRVLVERPDPEEEMPYGLRAVVWGDPGSEDYSREIPLVERYWER